jgi:hypothetical protein
MCIRNDKFFNYQKFYAFFDKSPILFYLYTYSYIIANTVVTMTSKDYSLNVVL